MSKRSKLYWMPNILADSWVGNSKYHHLDIDLFELAPPDPAIYGKHTWPLPVLDTPGSRRTGVTLRWQANAGEVHPDTIDGKRWYGCSVRMEVHSCAIPKALRWVCRQFPDNDPSPRQVLDAFTEKGLQQVSYSAVFGKHVLARHWDDSEEYRCYYDRGAKPEGQAGCLVNAYVHQSFDESTVTRAIEEALRDSRYCSVDDLVRWVSNGRRWARQDLPPDRSHLRPLTRSDILGRPQQTEAKLAA